MVIGFWQILLIVYVLFIAIGPRRVVRWVQWGQRTNDRLRGRPPREQKPKGWLRAIQLFEYSTQLGWACVAIGIALVVVDGVCRQSGCGFHGPPVLMLAMLFLFLAPWLL
jgi:hypothetical protein